MKSKLRKGTLIPVYKKSQTNEQLLGIGRLVSKKKDGLPFIVDSEADNKQKVWVEEHWEIQWILTTALGLTDPRKVFPIRTLFNEGITSSFEDSGDDKNYLLRDKFIKSNGIEIY